tara:strand:- start:4 stop:153 length:150 start_codon:yes stop_codon:yes gene_type:complete
LNLSREKQDVSGSILGALIELTEVLDFTVKLSFEEEQFLDELSALPKIL